VNHFSDENGCFGCVEGAIKYQRGREKRKKKLGISPKLFAFMVFGCTRRSLYPLIDERIF
jgi:hypothetical protein